MMLAYQGDLMALMVLFTSRLSSGRTEPIHIKPQHVVSSLDLILSIIHKVTLNSPDQPLRTGESIRCKNECDLLNMCTTAKPRNSRVTLGSFLQTCTARDRNARPLCSSLGRRALLGITFPQSMCVGIC